ncbi:hypothetical protein AB0425_32265 [Actinosynnema sp. NPDC051121]
MEPVWIAASAASASAVAAFVSAGAAIWSARNGNRTLKRAELDGQARSRPIVTAELREEPFSQHTLLLVVRNSGQTIARNIVVLFDPPLPDPTPVKASDSLIPFLKRRYAHPIPMLAPGAELDNIYYAGESPKGTTEMVNYEDVPNQVTVTIAYEAQDGAKYTDEYRIDVEVMLDKTYVSGGTHHPKTQRAKIVKSLENLAAIKTTLATIAKNMPKDTPPRPPETGEPKRSSR